MRLGNACFRDGRYAEASEAFAGALSLNVDDKAAQAGLRASISKAGLPPPPILAAPALVAEVRDLAGRKRYAEALAKAESLSALAPDWPLDRLMIADLRYETGDPSGALTSYDRFLSFEPSHRAARLNKARTLSLLGRREEALVLVRDLLRENPSDEGAKVLLLQLTPRN